MCLRKRIRFERTSSRFIFDHSLTIVFLSWSAAADLFDDGIPEPDLGLDDEGEDTYEFNLGVETDQKDGNV